jgi:hypothetical protein
VPEQLAFGQVGRDGREWAERGLTSWTARAINSLPVPVSPLINTELSVGPTCSTIRSTSCRAGLAPMIPVNCDAERTSARNTKFSASARLRSSSISSFCRSISLM